jgi:hypothetical protein
MPTFLYRCPNTGLRVQGWIANGPTERDEDSFEAVTCPACGRVHLVNPQTGKVLGANDDALAPQDRAAAANAGSRWRHRGFSSYLRPCWGGSCRVEGERR